MNKYKFKLNYLDCASCAQKIENALNKDQNIHNAVVNFATLTISLETDFDGNIQKLVNNIIQKVENDVQIVEVKEKRKIINIDILRIIIGIILFIFSLFITNNIIKEIITILAYIILLSRVIKKAIKGLISNFIIDENLLITISCICAYLTHNTHEGLMVIILYEIGKILESMAINNSRKSISNLMDIKPLYANLKKNNKIVKVNPEDVQLNDIIVVKKGEKVPLDGIVINGSSYLDKSMLTGEVIKEKVTINDNILSGSINTGNILTIKVTKLYEDSTVSQILSLVENATDKKAKTENFVTKASLIYTPIILILALLIVVFLPIFTSLTFQESLYRSLIFLVVSCPCAIAISIPLSYFSAIGAASSEGILIKGSNYLDGISNIKEIIFDKTGTITNGNFNKYDLKIYDNKYLKEDIIKYFKSGEELSVHPIAKSIVNLFLGYQSIKVNNFHEEEGKGISFKVKNDYIKIGSNKYCNTLEDNKGIYLSINNLLVARLIIDDGIKKDASTTIKKLKELGINVKMFTGDNKKLALNIANLVGIDDVCYELLPNDKYNLLDKELDKYNGAVAFVGDGINDAPSLKMAKVGISMGMIGSDAAIAASDIVIMNDNLNSILVLLNIARKNNLIIKENLIFALGIKVLILLLSLLGISTMWQAVFADTGVTLLTIINTTRIIKRKK